MAQTDTSAPSDPLPPAPAPYPRWKQIRNFPFIILSIWFLSFAGPLSFFLPFFMIYLLMSFLSQKRYAALAFLMMTSPSGLAFLLGAYDYTQGNLHLRTIGLPEVETFNLNPWIRAGNTSSGCIVDGSEFTTHLPYNAAAYLLSLTLGPQPGTYTGPYPTKAEAKSAIEKGVVISFDTLQQDRIDIDKTTIRLDTEVGSTLLKRIVRYYPDPEQSPPELKAALWQQECLILSLPRYDWGANVWQSSSTTVLISRAVGRPFAYYSEGERYFRSPPVPWKPRPN